MDAEKLARLFELGRKLAQKRDPRKREPAYLPPAWTEDEDQERGPEGGVPPRAWRGIGWR